MFYRYVVPNLMLHLVTFLERIYELLIFTREILTILWFSSLNCILNIKDIITITEFKLVKKYYYKPHT